MVKTNMNQFGWQHIDESKPMVNQPVYYYFGVFDSIYEGFYERYSDKYYKEGLFSDVFYSDNYGFLTDDITWWMPRIILPENIIFTPSPPTDEQKVKCKYHPRLNGQKHNFVNGKKND